MWLGINFNGMHDSSLAMIDSEGNVRIALSEERLSRVKKDGRFPARALRQVDLSSVHQIAVPYLKTPPPPSLPDPVFAADLLPVPGRISPYHSQWLKQLDQLTGPKVYFDHHLSHAAAGYFLSGMSEALVVTSDAGAHNCAWSSAIYHATPERLDFLRGASICEYWPLSRIYTDTTALLGFKPNMHEGKITGLAAYGHDNRDCEEALWEVFTEITDREVRGSKPLLYRWVEFIPDVIPTLQVDCHVRDEFRYRLRDFSDEDLARAAQNLITRRLCRILSTALALYPHDSIILSGGMFANVKLNLDIKKMGTREIFICPPMGDEGTALGAAVLARSQETGASMIAASSHHLFWGTPIPEEISIVLDRLGIRYTLLDDVAGQIAKLLGQGQIIGLVHGSMEFGPRALGNRSILCQATDPTINQRLNARLKRTEFMPFAPIVRAEDSERLFELDELRGAEHAAEFMTICFHCTDWFKQTCPAVVHVDGTARPQIVHRDRQPLLHSILTTYASITGIPALINTSFNVHDEPIVATIGDAILGLLQCQLDSLIIENHLIRYADNSDWLSQNTSECREGS